MRILLVEDDPLVVKVFVRYLSRRGEMVEVVDSSTKACLALECGVFDLVLTDHELRDGPRGLLVIEHLRRTNPLVPRCLMSGGSLVDETSAHGKHETFLAKPFTLVMLGELVDWARCLLGERRREEDIL